VLENPAIEKVGQNLKYDMIVLRSVGVSLAGVRFDTIIASYLLDAGERKPQSRRIGWPLSQSHDDENRNADRQRQSQKRWTRRRSRKLRTTAAEDADVALRLVPLLAAGLKESKLEPLFNDVEVPLMEVLAELE